MNRENTDIILQSKIVNDSYTEYVYNTYDIQNRDIVTSIIKRISLPEFDWNIGLICGNSGSGKSTLLKDLGGDEEIIEFDNSKTVISNFSHVSEEEASKILTSVGLSSVPSWLKTYNVLSNGEKFRADMALRISKTKGICFVDEFTSVVDRNVAKAVSNSIYKWIKREKKQIIFASCHHDIIDWLRPDWIYSPETELFVKKKSKKDQIYNLKFLEQSIMHGIYSKNIII